MSKEIILHEMFDVAFPLPLASPHRQCAAGYAEWWTCSWVQQTVRCKPRTWYHFQRKKILCEAFRNLLTDSVKKENKTPHEIWYVLICIYQEPLTNLQKTPKKWKLQNLLNTFLCYNSKWQSFRKKLKNSSWFKFIHQRARIEHHRHTEGLLSVCLHSWGTLPEDTPAENTRHDERVRLTRRLLWQQQLLHVGAKKQL